MSDAATPGPGAGRLHARLERDGFAVTPFIDAGTVTQLLAAFRELALDDEPWYTTTGHADRATAMRVDRMLRTTLATAVAAVMPDTRAFTGAFISKASTETSRVHLHQDWTYVDETEARAHLIWCPLIDVGPVEGTLHVVPGSHRWSDLPRGAHFPLPFEEVETLLVDEHAVPVPLPAGHAIVYDSALLHYSPPNRSGAVRPAVALGLAPTETPLVHHYGDDQGVATVYRVDDGFLTEHPNGSEPHGYPVLDRYRISQRRITPAEVGRLAAAAHR